MMWTPTARMDKTASVWYWITHPVLRLAMAIATVHHWNLVNLAALLPTAAVLFLPSHVICMLVVGMSSCICIKEGTLISWRGVRVFSVFLYFAFRQGMGSEEGMCVWGEGGSRIFPTAWVMGVMLGMILTNTYAASEYCKDSPFVGTISKYATINKVCSMYAYSLHIVWYIFC